MKKSATTRTGKIIPHGVKPEPHELDTILFYTERGEDIELIPESHTPGDQRPDLLMSGLSWESKSPTNNNRTAIERIFYRASSQSSNIIIDLRRIKGDDEKPIALLEKCFKNTRRVRILHIITKKNELRVYKK